MPWYVQLLIILAVIVVLAVVLLIVVRRRMAEAGVYVKPRTKFGPALVFTVEGDDGTPVRVLNVDGMYQSATYLDDDHCYDLVFKYTELYDRMFEADLDIKNVRMIGGGGYSYPEHFISENPDARMDVVEIDPAITSLAQRFFFLDRLFAEFDLDETGRLGLVCDDGRAYLDACAKDRPGTYDVVLNDSFSGKLPVKGMATVEAARSIHDSLTDGGLYMVNVVSALEGDGARLIRSVVATLQQAFAHVYVIPCGVDEFADRDNNMVVASDGVHEFSNAYDVSRLGISPDDPVLTDANNPVQELAK